MQLHHPVVQSLEPRTLLTRVFVVDNTNDSGNGSLRDAITNADTVTTGATIVFDLQAGVQTLTLVTSLPPITTQVDLVGPTDSGGNPLFEIDAQNTGEDNTCLDVARNTPSNQTPSFISGLIINRVSEQGFILSGDAPTDVFGCRIGTDPTGKKARPNGGDGILVDTADCQIGAIGPGPAFQNVISANGGAGVDISANGVGTLVQNCLIGTDVTGKKALGNGGDGINCSAADVTIGGFRPDQANVISANGSNGIVLNSTATDALVISNMIGTNAAGTAALANTHNGITVAANDDQIGDPNAGGSNLISGNDSNGVVFDDCTTSSILNNVIGTNLTKTAAIPNNENGIVLQDASANSIQDNTVSGNADDGILIEQVSGDANSNELDSNVIGTNDSKGDISIPNGGNGIDLVSAANSAILLDTIAFNKLAGVEISGNTATGNLLDNDTIFSNAKLGICLGTNTDTPLPNTGPGTGPNDLLPYPVLTSAVASGGKITVVGNLSSGVPNAPFKVNIYLSYAADPTGFGQGQFLIGDVASNTDGSGNLAINLPITHAATLGQVITTVATNDNNGDTSEFSKAISVTGASITGTVFNDANGNGKQDTGEVGLAHRTVFIDLNDNGVFDPGTDISTTTNSKGHFRLFGVAPGTYHILLAPTSGWKQTDPGSKQPFYKVTVPALDTVGGLIFGETKIASPSAIDAIVASDDLIAIVHKSRRPVIQL